MARFLALSGDEAKLRELLTSTIPPAGSMCRLNRVFECEDLILFASPETPLLPLDQSKGIIVGRLYSNDQDCRAVHEVDCSFSRDAIRSGGRTFLRSCWGNYVAFFRDDHDLFVLRDPSGAIPVHRLEHRGLQLFFSHLELAEELVRTLPGVDLDFVRHWLLFPHLGTARTGIEGVREILPGEICRTRATSIVCEMAWTPWAFTTNDKRIDYFAEAARRLRSTAERTVAAQLAHLKRPLLQLSGGLDSAIVAACMAQLPDARRAVNFSTRLPDGDERHYAGAIASALGLSLTELGEGDLTLDLTLGRRRPRPSISPVLDPLNRILSEHARKTASDGLVTGAGGDNLFCYLTTTAPLLDSIESRGVARSLDVLVDLASMTGSTIWTVARYAIAKRLRRNRRERWKSDRRFLRPSALPERPEGHPWLEAPRKTCMGKLEHVESLVRAHYFAEAENAFGETLAHPLFNQPLMELCLAIPSWLWLRGGRNRAVARAAFTDRLPLLALERRTKGRLESMCHRIYVENRPALSTLLLGGSLANLGILETRQLGAYLERPEPPDEAYFRIFDLAAMEVWLRSMPQ